MEGVQASELTLQVEYFRNRFWAILQLFFFFSSYCLQSSYGFEMYLIVVLNSIIKQSGDFSNYAKNICFFWRTEIRI